MMSTRNPIDIIGDADSARVRQILINISQVRTQADIIFFFTVQATTDIDAIANEIIQFSETHRGFNIFIGLIGGNTVTLAQTILSNAEIFVTSSTESMIRSYSKLLEWKF